MMTFRFDAVQLAAIFGVVVPFGVALLTKVNASPHLKSLVSAVLAVLAAVGASLAAFGPGKFTITQVLPNVLIAAATAAGTRWGFTKDLADGLGNVSAAFGLGGTKPAVAPLDGHAPTVGLPPAPTNPDVPAA
jgi:hypothetical protein